MVRAELAKESESQGATRVTEVTGAVKEGPLSRCLEQQER